MELLLIRHALPVRLETSDGPADPRLSATGRTQAEALARHWAGRVDAVWTSPLRRARETATPLLDRLGLSATVDDDLTELDRGAAAYIPIEELRADPVRGDEAVASWTGPDGEALRTEFRVRVVAAVARIVLAHPGQRVAVVCHGGGHQRGGRRGGRARIVSVLRAGLRQRQPGGGQPVRRPPAAVAERDLARRRHCRGRAGGRDGAGPGAGPSVTDSA